MGDCGCLANQSIQRMTQHIQKSTLNESRFNKSVHSHNLQQWNSQIQEQLENINTHNCRSRPLIYGMLVLNVTCSIYI